jgi:hypothetical protein
MYVFVGIAALCFIGWKFSSSKPPANITEKKSQQDMVGATTDSQFAPATFQVALEQQQKQVKDLTDKLTEISNKMSEIQNTLCYRKSLLLIFLYCSKFITG